MQLVENTVIAGRFRLNRLIGRGGMGSVWQATHLGLDIPCAVKFIEGEMASLPEAQARFEREAKAAAQLRSPHVVQILDHGVCEGTPYIAMELLDGEDVGKRLARVGRMAPAELHGIVNQVCRALGKAHAAGIVHRDLKPDNIFLVRDEDREITKVLDFGIAKSRGNELGASSNTKTGAMLGTPYYMSPEQAQGTKQVDSRSDLWALAIICFQALTGKLPFESEALGDLLVKIIVSPIPIPSQFGPVPPGFDAWWLKAASREASERFQTAKDFSDSLAVVCGVSQVSGIVDRSRMHQAASGPSADGSGGFSPPTYPNHLAQSALGPAMASTQGALPLAPAPTVGTGAPMSRTFADGAGGIPTKSNTGLIAGIVVAVTVVVLGGGGFLGYKAVSGSSSSHAAATNPPVVPSALPPPPTATVAAAPDTKPAAPVVDPATNVAPPVQSAAPVASPSPAVAAAAEPHSSHTHGGGSSSGGSKSSGPVAPSKPDKSGPNLGF